MSSLDRLIELSQRTGDRLIVHDPIQGRDVVVMGIDAYEHLVLGKRPIRELSERELIDQINRDIAVWRAHQEQEDVSHLAAALEDELVANPPSDPFEEDIHHRPEWHTAGSVIDKEYKGDTWMEELDAQVELVPETPAVSKPTQEPQPVRYERQPEAQSIPQTEPLLPEDPIFYEEPV